MDGNVPQNGDIVFLGDSRGFMLIPSILHLNTKLFADLPVLVCSGLVVVCYDDDDDDDDDDYYYYYYYY